MPSPNDIEAVRSVARNLRGKEQDALLAVVSGGKLIRDEEGWAVRIDVPASLVETLRQCQCIDIDAHGVARMTTFGHVVARHAKQGED